MRVSSKKALVAPDSFKGTLSASQAAMSIASGLKKSGWSCDILPIADGGEGTLDVLTNKLKLKLVPVEVTGPLGTTITSRYGLSPDGKLAIVEMADACGLELVGARDRDPIAATSHGVGELVRTAAADGARNVIVAAGGSATCDGGRGALEALGAKFKRQGVDLEAVQKLLKGVVLRVACDVRSPFTGPAGAAHVYAPQKGADDKDVATLERRLKRLAGLARQTTGRNPTDVAMAGAGGGLAGGLWALAKTELKPGAPLVLELLDLDSALETSSFVVTGEGKLDRQTLAGKAPAEVAIAARQRGIPCHAIVGLNKLDAFDLRQLDLHYVYEARARGTRAVKKALTTRAFEMGKALKKDFDKS